MAALDELTAAWEKSRHDAAFQAELAGLLSSYTGRPSPVTDARRFAEHAGGARVLLKREDLNHTGSHKINNVLGQALLTRDMGKTRVIAETGAGQHGVATATAAALLGLECVVYMGAEDTRRQALNVARMRLLGAEVVAVEAGSQTLKDAINEAMRDWVTNVERTHYILGTVTGPHPFPSMVRDFQRVIGDEARQQVLELTGRLPDAVVACVGGGSNAMGIFTAFLDDAERAALRLRGRRRGGRDRPARGPDGRRLARRPARHPHLRDAGRDGPDRALALDLGRSRLPRRRSAALLAQRHRPGDVRTDHRRRGDGRVRPALPHRGHHPGHRERARARRRACRSGVSSAPDATLLVNLSGRGDKDVDTAAKWFEVVTDEEIVESATAVVEQDPQDASGEGW